MTASDVRAFGAQDLLDPSAKGYPPGVPPMTAADLARRGWSALGAELTRPVALLRRSAIASNVETMRRFCRSAGVELAPHAKTTMAPALLADQLDAGAWAMTAATPRQVLQLWDFGVPRVVLANEVAEPAALRALAERLCADPALDLLIFVDSVAGARMADTALADAGAAADGRGAAGVRGAAEPGAGRRLDVLVDLGHEAGRTGVRDVGAALLVADAVREADHLVLAGVGGFEGTIGTDRSAATLGRVDDYLRFAVEVAERLLEPGAPATGFDATFGGSAYFDRVVEALEPLRNRGARVVLRSGCYLIHDQGLYAGVSPATTDAWTLPPFAPALEVWTTVISRPEPGLVLLNAGKRDLSFDAGLPVAIGGVTGTTVGRPARALDVAGLAVSALSDQHAFLPVPVDHPVAVGDLVGLGISHPCTTIDRWPLLYLVDDDHRIVDVVRSYV